MEQFMDGLAYGFIAVMRTEPVMFLVLVMCVFSMIVFSIFNLQE